MTKWFFLFSLVFIPLYLLRLSQTSVYKIPEGIPVRIIGHLSSQPYLKGSQQIIRLGPAMIITSRFPGYFYGQKSMVLGKFEKKVINKFQAQYSASFPEIQVIQNNEVARKDLNSIALLMMARGQTEQRIAQFLPELQASLLSGILFGIKRQMPEKFLQNLRETGTLHIVVTSGQNVSLVVRFLIATLVWTVSRRQALALAIMGVVVYILMVGAEPPVMRAGMMATLAYVAQASGRDPRNYWTPEAIERFVACLRQEKPELFEEAALKSPLA
jgi:hypothetical protein